MRMNLPEISGIVGIDVALELQIVRQIAAGLEIQSLKQRKSVMKITDT
jgi:hypothetical protein